MRRGSITVALVVGACGPAVSVSDETASDASTATDTSGAASITTADSGVATATGTTGPLASTSDSGPSGYEDDDGGTGCTFTCPDPPDPPGPGGGGACDLWAQTCAEGQKCMPWANDGGLVHNATRCSPVDPSPRQIGESCVVEGSFVSGVDNCDLGGWCAYVDPDTADGVCVELCGGAAAAPVCETAGTQCVVLHGFLPVCTLACDPLTDDCGMGAGCHPVGSGFACLPSMYETSAAGEPCEIGRNACASGLYCVDDSLLSGCEASRCCTDFCDVTDPGGDAQCSLPGTTCTLLVDDPPSATWENLGACLTP